MFRKPNLNIDCGKIKRLRKKQNRGNYFLIINLLQKKPVDCGLLQCMSRTTGDSSSVQ